MRIISGTSKGRRLFSPDGKDFRPTADRVKEGLFSAIQFDIEGRRVLDLFAGSGQLGIEALSRGAENAVFVDNSAESVKVLKKNVETGGFEDRSKIVVSDFSAFCKMNREPFDIAFLDPPYYDDKLITAITLVSRHMSDYGLIICEHPKDFALPETTGGFKIAKVYRYGKIALTLYRKEVVKV